MAYLLFAYDDVCPRGGMDDCVGIFTTLEEAKAAEAACPGIYGYDHIEIWTIDGTTMRWVAKYQAGQWHDAPAPPTAGARGEEAT